MENRGGAASHRDLAQPATTRSMQAASRYIAPADSSQGASTLPATVDNHIDRLQNPLLRFLTDLCAIDTSNPPGRNYKACCELLQHKLDSLGLATKLYRVPKAQQARLVPGLDAFPRYNLVARWDVGAARTLHLTGHYDVVPATGGWNTDPFSPVVRSGRFFARGAADMKGADACAIFAIEALRRAGLTPPWNIELSFTADEETGGEAGLGWLVKQKKINPDAGLLLEGGSGLALGFAARGVQWANVVVHGKPAHAMNPAAGVNATLKAAAVTRQLHSLNAHFAKRLSKYPAARIHARRPTIMVGGVAATGPGDKINTIPDRFTFSVDRRILPDERIADVRRELRDAVRRAARLARCKADLHLLMHAQPGFTDPRHQLCRLGRAAVRHVRRKSPALRMSGGFNDLRFLTNDGGVPTIGYGLQGRHAHSDNESIALTELRTVTRIYAQLVMNMPHPDEPWPRP